MSPRYGFGAWTPDLPPLANQKGVTVARNILPIAGGYGPLASLAPVGNSVALDDYCRGAIGGTDFATNAFSFSGDELKLYSGVDSLDVSRAAGYATSNEDGWQFAQFGSNVFATNFFDPLQYFSVKDFTPTAKFKDVSELAIAPAVPRARHIAVIDNFLVLGNIYDPVDGLQTNAISWSGINNGLAWPLRNTDGATEVLSDKQRLEGAGGVINAVVPGSEVGAIFQEHAIWRLDFVGGDVIFSLSRVEPNRGLLIPNLAVAVGREIFYLSEDGFYMFNYTGSRPIGKDKINRTFLADLDSEFFYRVSALRDPDQTRIYVLYPGQGNVNGSPNKMLVYDWALDRFSEAEVTAEVLVWFFEPGAHLDSPGTAEDPDQLEGDPDENDPPGNLSFDDRATPVGSATIGAYNSSHVLSTFSGVNMTGTIETGDIELAPGRRSMMKTARPLVDDADITVQVAGLAKRPRPDEVLTYGRRLPQERHGGCSVHVDARYHRLRFNLTPTFENAVGCDISGRATGNK